MSIGTYRTCNQNNKGDLPELELFGSGDHGLGWLKTN